MTYLLDTNVISEVTKGSRCDPNLAFWYRDLDEGQIFLSVLVVGEIRKGIERLRSRDSRRARALEEWLGAVRDAFGGRILPIGEAVADEWGRLSAGRTVAAVDGLLAATARVHGLILATRNTADMAGLGTALFNPFEPPQA